MPAGARCLSMVEKNNGETLSTVEAVICICIFQLGIVLPTEEFLSDMYLEHFHMMKEYILQSTNELVSGDGSSQFFFKKTEVEGFLKNLDLDNHNLATEVRYVYAAQVEILDSPEALKDRKGWEHLADFCFKEMSKSRFACLNMRF